MLAIMLPQRGREIRAELIRRGYSLADIARRTGTNRATVSRVISGNTRSRRIEGRICQVLGIAWGQLFPPLKREPRRHRRRPHAA